MHILLNPSPAGIASAKVRVVIDEGVIVAVKPFDVGCGAELICLQFRFVFKLLKVNRDLESNMWKYGRHFNIIQFSTLDLCFHA